MRRTGVMSIAISLGVLACAPFGYAAYSASEPSAVPVKMFEASGRIVSVDAQQKRLMFAPVSKGESKMMTFAVDDQAAISRAGIPLRADDLQPSEEAVWIEYSLEGGKPVAQTIRYEKPSGLRRTEGTVESIDLLKGEVAITPSGLLAGDTQRQFIIVNEYTVVSRDGQKAHLTDLMVGNRATIEYTKSGDTFVAYSLEIHPATPRTTP